jgi:aromatic ring-cleaving dioxygenase
MAIHQDFDPIREFDAHIYFTSESRESADRLRRQIARTFPTDTIRVGQLVDRPIGPHPTPMFELNFIRGKRDELVRWLTLNRGEHTVLVHEVTGDDPRDHTIGALWLGEPVQLDFSKLEPPLGNLPPV